MWNVWHWVIQAKLFVKAYYSYVESTNGPWMNPGQAINYVTWHRISAVTLETKHPFRSQYVQMITWPVWQRNGMILGYCRNITWLFIYSIFSIFCFMYLDEYLQYFVMVFSIFGMYFKSTVCNTFSLFLLVSWLVSWLIN